MQRKPADLANAFSDDVRHRKELFSMFIKKQMIIPEVMPAHMPVKILRFQIQRENVSKDCIHRARDLLRRFGRKVGSCFEWCVAPVKKLCFSRIRFSHSSTVFGESCFHL